MKRHLFCCGGGGFHSCGVLHWLLRFIDGNFFFFSSRKVEQSLWIVKKLQRTSFFSSSLSMLFPLLLMSQCTFRGSTTSLKSYLCRYLFNTLPTVSCFIPSAAMINTFTKQSLGFVHSTLTSACFFRSELLSSWDGCLLLPQGESDMKS